MKKVAILQSNYIPWKGYFDLINMADEFIFYDEVQYTKNDWRNRNKIKTPNGLVWLTIPVYNKDYIKIKIKEALIVDNSWIKKHRETIIQNYKKAPYFNEYKDIFLELYNSVENEKYLCEINYFFIRTINKILGINTKLSFSTDYNLIDGKTERLIDLVKQAGGTEYISGPAAKNYIDNECFKDADIKLTYMDYSGYPEYPQLHGEFSHNVSILDLLFNTGNDAPYYIWGWRENIIIKDLYKEKMSGLF